MKSFIKQRYPRAYTACKSVIQPFRKIRSRIILTIRKIRLRQITKQEFIEDVRTAIASGRPYAAGGCGPPEYAWMYYEIFLDKMPSAKVLASYEKKMCADALGQAGVFPATPCFLREYGRFYSEHFMNLDCYGVAFYKREYDVLRYYGYNGKMIFFPMLQPDLSIPENDQNCYLQYLRDKKLLLVCPFGHFLKERATKETYEKVWAKTGKKWFYPRAVYSVEFPYGFDPQTHNQYKNEFALFEAITQQINSMDYDIALIGAGGLAIPLASHVKKMGKVAIDLGGCLQIIFGVIGGRWRNLPDWQRNYFNEWWVDLPERYKPNRTDICDGGAYW